MKYIVSSKLPQLSVFFIVSFLIQVPNKVYMFSKSPLNYVNFLHFYSYLI